MRLRLPHILSLMVLILAAGVVTVRRYEARAGALTVPGLVVLDAPWLDVVGAGPLLAAWPEARLWWVAADGEPLSPFGASYARRAAADGARTVFVAKLQGAALTSPGVAFDTVLDTGGDALAGARTLADFLTDHSSTVPFVAALPLDDTAAALLDQIVRTLHLAVTQLPSFRRTSLVVLGLREPGSGRRLALRIDHGHLPRPPLPALRDLTEPDW